LFFLLLFFVGVTSAIKPKDLAFQIRSGRNLAGMFFNKCISTDGVGFPQYHHNFKMTAMMSFHAEKCCRLVSKHETSAGTHLSVLMWQRPPVPDQ